MADKSFDEVTQVLFVEAEIEVALPRCSKCHFTVIARAVFFVCEEYICEQCIGIHMCKCGPFTFLHDSYDTSKMVKTLLPLLDDEPKRKDIRHLLKTEHISMCDRVDITHHLDIKKNIVTGLCGLKYRLWAVCDYNNSCIKIYKVGSNMLRRYIRFASPPYAIKELQKTPASMHGDESLLIKSDSKVQKEENRRCLVATTIPRLHKILILEIKKTSIAKVKDLHVDKPCWALDSFDYFLITLCKGEGNAPWFIYIFRTDHCFLKIIRIDNNSRPQNIAAREGRIYITDCVRSALRCVDGEGKTIAVVKIPGFNPTGVAIDDSGRIYICSSGRDQLYQMDSDLQGWHPLPFEGTDKPFAMCFHNDRLIVGNSTVSTECNIVTIYRIL